MRLRGKTLAYGAKAGGNPRYGRWRRFVIFELIGAPVIAIVVLDFGLDPFSRFSAVDVDLIASGSLGGSKKHLGQNI